MSTLQVYGDQLKGYLREGIHIVRIRAFGANNEKLDFIMDSFYKLTPPQRTSVLAGVIGAVVLFVLCTFWLYFAQVGALKKDLNDGFEAIHELQTLKSTYDVQNQRFTKLVDNVRRSSGRVKMKPFLEKIAQDMGVIIDDLSEQKVPLPAESPLAEKMQEVKVDLRLPKISLPRLLTFLIEIEKSNSYVRIEDLQIRGRYGTKLYFDGQAKARGYAVER